MSAIRLLLSCILAFVLLPLLAFSEPNNEVISKRTRTAKTFLNAGGTYTTHVHLRPIHEKDASGSWVDIVRNAPGAAKAANYNERQVDPGFFCVGRDGDGVYAWADWDNGGLFGDDNNNIVGYLQDRPVNLSEHIVRYSDGTISVSSRPTKLSSSPICIISSTT